MKSLKLISLSAIIILILGGIPHLIAYGDLTDNVINTEGDIIEEVSSSDTVEVLKVEQSSPYAPLLGKWKVSWDSEEIKGSAIYQIKEVGETIKGFSVKLFDEHEQSMNDNTHVFTLKSFKDKKGKGIYKLDYEGEGYEIPCKIELITPNQLKVSYDYYGYADTEIWNRVK